MAVEVATDYLMFIDGAPGRLDLRRVARGPQPGDAGARRARARRDRGGRRSGGRGGASVVRRRALAPHAHAGARRDHEPARRPDRRARRRARPARDAPDRDVVQAPARLRLRVRFGQPALLRDRDPPPRGQGRGRVHRLAHVDGPARADRRLRPGRAVELPDVDGDLEDRAGAGGRQLRRPQARVGDAADDGPARRAGPRGRPPGRRAERRDGPRRRRRVGDRGPPGRRPHLADRRLRTRAGGSRRSPRAT